MHHVWAARRRKATCATADDGFTLAEVLVALLVFALLSTGVIYTVLQAFSLTRDARNRQVAANLAAQAVDEVHDAANLFTVLDKTSTYTLNNDIFTVVRQTQWVTDPSTSGSCGTGGSGMLRYKRVNVTVTWDGMRSGTTPVRSDTVVAPDQAINDPTKGTILVAVTGSSGTPRPGVSITAVAAAVAGNTAVTVSGIAATDAQGCTYVLSVKPGTYNVTASRSGYLSVDQSASPVVQVSVGAGTSSSVSFQYDQAASYALTYASTYVAAGGETVRMPSTVPTTFVSTYATYVTNASAATTMTRTFSLHPFPSGYQVLAGDASVCPAADPEAWAAGTTAGGQTVPAGERSAGVAATPGGSVSTGVPMGIVKITGLGAASGKELRAVSQAVPGSPAPVAACASTMTLSFGTAAGYTVPASGTLTVALPYGSWKLYYGTGTPGTAVPVANLSLPSPAVPSSSSIDASGVVTFDPRAGS